MFFLPAPDLPLTGLFHFSASFRPVPLEMQFIGVNVTNFMAKNTMMAEICYGKVGLSVGSSIGEE